MIKIMRRLRMTAGFLVLIGLMVLQVGAGVTAQGLPPGMREQKVVAEAVYEYPKNLYFDESGNMVDDFADSYYGATYRVKYVLEFWNSGSLSKSGSAYGGAAIKAVLSPEGSAYVSFEGDIVKEAMAPWEGKHFDEYKNDPAWVEANRRVLEEIEAIKNTPLETITEPVKELLFSGGPEGVFTDPATKEVVGRVTQANGSWVVLFPQGINHSAHTGSVSSYSSFTQFSILTEDPFGQNAGDSGVRFSDFDGNVEVQPAGEDYWNIAELGMVLNYGDHIRTGVDSFAIISFKDMSTYTMKSESEIVLSQPEGLETKLQLVFGNLWVNVKKMAQDGTMEITMNQAVSGIKGTILICEQTKTESILKVMEGQVTFTDNQGVTVTVQSGERISASANGMGDMDKFDLDAEEKQWSELLAMDPDSSGSPSATTSLPTYGIVGGMLGILLWAGSRLLPKKKNG